MPKLDNSITEESNARVTRSSRRSGSVDLDLEQSSQRTPLKSNILETISETGSVDSRLTPRRATRRSVANLDICTPQKKSHLTKENLARLDNFNEATETPPSTSKRITRRTSITSEDVSVIAKTSVAIPFVKLARTKLPTNSEEVIGNLQKRTRGRSAKLETVGNPSPSKVENKLDSPHYNTRRSVSISPSITMDELRVEETRISPVSTKKTLQKFTESTSTPSNCELDKTIRNHQAQALRNQTSTPNIPSRTVESNDSIDDNSIEYYRNSGLKKFTGTIQNKIVEEEPLKSETKFVEEITIINNDSHDKITDHNDRSNKEHITPQNKSNLSMNTSNFEKQDLESNEQAELKSTNKSKISDSEKLQNKSGNEEPNHDIAKESQTTKNQKKENAEKEINLETTSEDTSKKQIILETPTKERVSTPSSFKKATPKSMILVTSAEEVTPAKLDKSMTPLPTKLVTPAKQATPLKQATPFKQGTPAKSATPLVEKLQTPKTYDPALKASPLKQATPFKQGTSAKSATPLVEKLQTPITYESPAKINTKIDLNEISKRSENIIECPGKLNNSNQSIESNCNNSKVLFTHEDDVSVQQYVDEPSNLNNTVDIINESVSISSSDDAENIDSSPDRSIIDTFENFTDNLFRTKGTKAKSCSPKISKKTLLQSQARNSSIHGVRKCDELNKSSDSVSNLSKSASGMFFVEDENAPNQLETKKSTCVVHAASHKPSSGLFVEEDNNDETVTQDDVSNVEISSCKKQKRRSSSFVETVMPMKSFVEEDNREETGPNISKIETNSAKKQKRKSLSIVDAIIPLNNIASEFIETEDLDGASEELKVTELVTELKNKLECKLLVVESDSDDKSMGPLNTSAGAFVDIDNDLNLYDSTKKLNSSKTKKDGSVTKHKNKLDCKSLVYESVDQPANPLNTSADACAESDNDLNLLSNERNKKLNSSKTKKSKLKSPKVMVAGKREISMEEIEATCNKILQERELARQKLREQFAKKKDKKKTKIRNDTHEDVNHSTIESLDQTRKPVAILICQEIEQSSPKSKKHLEHEDKPKSANSTQTKMDVSVNINNFDSSKGKLLKKQLSQNKSLVAASQPVQMSPPKFKNNKSPSTSNRHLAGIILNQLNEQKEISQSTDETVRFRGEKRKFKLPSYTENETTPELLSPKGKKLKKQQSQKTSPIAPQPVQMSPTKIKNVKIPKIQLNDSFVSETPLISNRRLPDGLLDQLEENKDISQSTQTELRAKKRKLKLPTFTEKEKTPELRPGGFKVSPITPKILSNNFRVSIMPRTKMPKKKLIFKEPTNILPQPVWTTAGVFEESDVGQENRKKFAYSTTNFVVEDMGDNLNRAYGKIDKDSKADLIEFKQKNLFRKNVPRADAKHVLKSRRFEKGNIKLISK